MIKNEIIMGITNKTFAAIVTWLLIVPLGIFASIVLGFIDKEHMYAKVTAWTLLIHLSTAMIAVLWYGCINIRKYMLGFESMPSENMLRWLGPKEVVPDASMYVCKIDQDIVIPVGSACIALLIYDVCWPVSTIAALIAVVVYVSRQNSMNREAQLDLENKL